MDFWQVTLGGLLGSGLATTLLGMILARRIQRIQRQVEEEFNTRQSRRDYQRQALFELFGPSKMQFLRTKRAFDRWRDRNDFLEEQVVRAGNLAIRNLLLEKGHLIPPDLINHAESLIEHYDAWLEAFERERGSGKKANLEVKRIFVGPAGYPFPKDAEKAFRARADQLQRELFDVPMEPRISGSPLPPHAAQAAPQSPIPAARVAPPLPTHPTGG